MQYVFSLFYRGISLKGVSLRHCLLAVVMIFVFFGAGFSSLHAQIANSNALTAFPTFNGAVRAIAISGTTIYVGGDFTQATNSPVNGNNTITQNRLAAIDANTGALIPLALSLNNSVRCLAVGGGRVYVGGDFTMVNAATRNLVFSFDVGTNALNGWNPNTGTFNGAFVYFALDGTTLYCVGSFLTVNNTARKYGCAFDAMGTGSLLAFNPDIADNQSFAVAFDASQVFYGGSFSGINGDINRARFGSVDKTTGANAGWGASKIPQCCVHVIRSNGTYNYVGGSYIPDVALVRNKLAVFDASGNVETMWHPDISNGAVFTLDETGGFVYAGGSFTQVNGAVPRNKLCAFPPPPGAATVNGTFDPNITGGDVYHIAAGGGRVYAGGNFTTVGVSARQGFAVFSSTPAPTISSFTPTSAYPMQVVRITTTAPVSNPITQVQFGGVNSPSVKNVNSTTIDAVVPYGAMNGNVTISDGATAPSQAGFTVNAIPQVATFVGRGVLPQPANPVGQLVNLIEPLGIAFNGTGDMFIAESVGNIIRRVTEGGRASIFAGSGVPGLTNALGTAAQFSAPVDVAFDNANNLYVSDYSNNSIRKIDPAGNVTTLAVVNTPGGIVFDGTDLVVPSQSQHCIYKVSLGGVVTPFVGTSGMVGTTDAMGAAARFNNPMYIAKDASNNLYVTDCYNHRIRKITPAGNVTTLAGSTQGYADGFGAAAQFRFPSGIAVDPAGVVYVGDGFGGLASNHRVRMIQPNGMVTTLAGTGAVGTYSNGAYNVAEFPLTMGGAAVKGGDTLFVSGREIHDIRRIHIAKYQYVSGDAGIASNWRLLPGLVTPAPNFTGPGFQFILPSGTATATTGFTLGANCVMTVKNGATLRLNGNSTNSGAIIVENGGTLEVSNGVTLTNSGQLIIDNGATGGRLLLMGTGSVASTTPIYGDAVVPNNATLESGGAVAKNLFVSEIPSPMPGRLVISNTVGTTPPNAQSIGAAGTVTINSGGRLIIPNGNTFQHNNPTALSFTINNGGTLEINGSGAIAAAASTLNYVAGSTLEYSGAAAKTTGLEFPAAMDGNVLQTNTNIVSLNSAKILGASATLTLTSGRIQTSGANMLTVSNTAPTAIAATAGYIDGPLQRDMAASLAAPAQTYLFPVGVGATPYPFSIIQPTTGATGPRLQVQAFAGNAMGMAGTNISLLSTTEYWQLQQISGNYTSGRIYVEKAGLLPTQAIGGNPAMANGTYNGNLSTLSTGLTTVSAVTGVGHFIVGTGPVTFVWSGAPGAAWNVATNWTPNRTTPAPTDILQFNGGTHTPTNIPTETIQQLIIGGNVTFAAVAAQTLTVGSGGVQITGGNSLDLGNNVILTQAAGATLQVDGTLNTSTSYVNGAGNLVLAASGTLATSRADGINGTALAQGAVQCSGTVTYTAGANYSFNSVSGAINTRFAAAGGKPAVTIPIGALVVNAANADISLDVNTTVNTAMTVQGSSAYTFIVGGNQLTLGVAATATIAANGRIGVNSGGLILNNNASLTSFTVQNGGFLVFQDNGAMHLSSASAVNYVPGSLLEYTGTAPKTTNNIEIGLSGVQQLLISNTQPVTLSGNVLVQQNLTVNDGSNLVLSNTGNPTLTLNGTINMNTTGKFSSVNGANAGSLVIGGGGTVSALRMDAVNNTLNNLTLNRAVNMVAPLDLNVRGTLDLQIGILVATTRIFSGDPTGTAAGVITGGGAGSYVQGKLQRRFTANIAAAGTNYAFPVGTNTTGYRPATLVNTLTGAASPMVEMEFYDIGATTVDIASVTSLPTPRNWRVQTMSGNFNGSAITLLEAGLNPGNVVARSVLQAGMYQGFGGNAIATTITSNAAAVPASANHYFAVASVQPSITGISPTTVSPGDTLLITGNQLGGVLALSIGGFPPASYTIVSPTLIRAVVGAGASGTISAVYVGGVATSMVSVVFNNAPIINDFSPTFGTTGATVRITGVRLGNPTNVAFGGTNALSLRVIDSTAVDAVVGNGSSGIVTLQNAVGAAASTAMFDFILKPSIVNFFPKWAKAGDTVNIFGGNFQRVSSVRFGASAPKLSFNIVTSGQIRILYPADASTGLIRLENPVGQDSLGTMTDVKPPTISSAFPAPLLAIGQTITISGTQFHPFPVVRIGSVTAATLEWTSLTELRATFAQATIGNLTVIASGGTVAQSSFIQVVAPPTITSFAPASPLPGDLVTVTGASLIANLLAVRVNGLPVQNLVRLSDNLLTFTMPNTTTGPIAITTLGGSTTASITFQPLTVTAAQPMSALPGTDVTLTGTRFTGVTQVRFGSITASQFTVISPTQLNVRVPLGATGGTTSVFVTGAAGTGVLNGFTLLVPAPVISSFSPFRAAPAQIVTISGLNFSGTTQVKFGGVAAEQFTVVSGTQITATVPANASSGSITVVNAAGMGARPGFTVLPPVANPSAALSKYPTFNGSVFAVAVNGAGTVVYVGGDFTEAKNSPANGGNTLTRNRLAAINIETGAVITTNIPTIDNGTVNAIAVDNTNNAVYVGGTFTAVNGGTARGRLCRFNAASGALDAWQTQFPLNELVNGLSLNATNTVIYAVGGFTSIMNNPGWNNGCGFNTVDGTLSGFVPNIANVAQAVVVDGANSSIKVAGHFAQTNGIPRQNRVASLTTGAQDIPAWDAKIQDGVGLALALDGGTLYVGGNFTTVDGAARSKFCAIPSANGNPVIDWNPNMNNDVWAIATDGANVYAGGTFTSVNGSVPRNALAAFPKAPAAATVTDFNPDMTGGDVRALAVSGSMLFAGGAFTSVGGQARRGFAVFNTNGIGSTGGGGGMAGGGSANSPVINSVSPEAAAPMQVVTLTGANFTGITKVEFGEKEAWFKVVSDTVIRAVVPFGAASAGGGSVSIVVSTAQSAGSREGFTVSPTPLVSTLAGNGMSDLSDSAGQSAALNAPRFGAKIGNHLYFSTVHAIRKLNLQTGEVSTLAGGLTGGNGDGTGAGAQFNNPFGLLPCNEFGGAGSTHLLVADYSNSRLRIVDIVTGAVRLFAGTGQREYADATLAEAGFFTPQGLARSAVGNILVTDHEAQTVRELENNSVSTPVGLPGIAGSDDGFTEDATLNGPSGIAADNENNIYVADRNGNTIRKISLVDGTVTTLAGTGAAGFADGPKGAGQLNSPIGLALNGTTLFVADAFNHRIRAVSTQTGEIKTIAGGAQGFADGTQQSAQFNAPHALVWDNENSSLIVFDTDNHRIRRVAVGTITFAPATGNTMTMTNGSVTVTNATPTMRITDVSPKTIVEGEHITLSGEHIATNATVSIGTLPLEIVEQSTTAIVVKTPNNIVPAIMISTNARLVITTPTVRLSVFPSVVITAREVPFVSVIFPNIATTRAVVSILGQHLAPLSAGVRGSVRQVSIGGVPVQAFAVISPTQIQVTVGSVRSGAVQIRTLSGQVLTTGNPFMLDTTRVQTGGMGGSTTATMPPVTIIPSVSPQDSIALNRLFAATQGAQWATTSNWTNGAPVALRFGIRVRDARVVEIRLPSAGLMGAIPPEVLQALDKLEVLDLSKNKLAGAIPPMLAMSPNLQVLNLEGNRFTGLLPLGFCAMGNLRELNLAGNSIEDSLARLCCLSGATSINLQGNKFTGTMPTCVQNLSGLAVLNLQGNGISGSIPDAVGQLRGLQVLNLRGNRFTGRFPAALGQRFGKAIAKTQESLGLEILDAGGNNFTGDIPEEIGNLPNLRIVLLDNNNFTGVIPKTFLSLARLRTLDVRNNQLTGGPDLVVIPRLDSLLVQNNRFSVVSLERFSGVRVFQYLPQQFPETRIVARSGARIITEATFTLLVNEPLALSVPRTENFSRTTWRKNGVPIRNLADTSRHQDITIPAFTLADSGVYDCVITNDRLPGIALTTAQIQVLGRVPMIIPTAVRLLAPGANEEDLPVEPRFRWTTSLAADAYRVEIAADSSFTTTVSTVQIPQSAEILAAGEVLATRTSAAALFARGFPLQNDRRYYWRVRAENSFGTSVWATGAFTTVPLNAELSIGTLDFGSVARRDTVRGVVKIRNFGAATLRLESIQTDNSAFVVDSLPAGTVLASGGELLARVSTPAEKIGNSVGGLTVFFRSAMNNTIQKRESANRLAVRVQAVKLTANPLDTVIVGKRVLTTVLVQNLSDELVTVRSVTMENKIPDFELQPIERNIEILPRQFETVRIAITAQKEGEIPEEILQTVVIRGDISTTVSRERFDTVRISSRVFARRARPEDMFIRIAVKAVQDSVAPGGAVTLELLLQPLGDATFARVLRAGTPSFAGSLRWNPNVLALSPGERGVRPVRLDSATSMRRTASPLQQFSLAPGMFWDGRSSLLLRIEGIAVAGNTDVTPIIIDNLQWGAGTVFIDSLIPGRFTAKPCEAGGKRLVTSAKPTQLAIIAPNPAKEQVSINYTLREDGFAEIALIDANGKTAQILLAEEQTAGEYSITRALKALPSGAYTVRLTTQGGVVSRGLNVVR